MTDVLMKCKITRFWTEQYKLNYCINQTPYK